MASQCDRSRRAPACEGANRELFDYEMLSVSFKIRRWAGSDRTARTKDLMPDGTRSASAALFFHAGQGEIEKLRHAEHSEQRSKGREHPGSNGGGSRSSITRECGQRAARFRLALPIEVFRNPAIALMLSRTSNLEPERLFPKDSQRPPRRMVKGDALCEARLSGWRKPCLSSGYTT
jgi:hypothetical protein